MGLIESPYKAIAHSLALKIAGDDHSLVGELSWKLTQQSDDNLAEWQASTRGYTDLHWLSLDGIMRAAFIDGELRYYDHLIDDAVPYDEFALRVAFELNPIAVAHHKDMVGSEHHSYGGETEVLDENDMVESIVSSLDQLLSETLPDEDSMSMISAYYLIILYGDKGHVPLPAPADFRWMQDNAMAVVEHAGDVFSNGVFDRELAELLAQAQPALREGVL